MRTLTDLLNIMSRLRDPEKGCPWDLKQDFDSIAPYTLEEAYEVIDAIERKDYESLSDELGDLLLQVVYHAQIASELGLFEFDDVVKNICDKLVRRHPHVFAPEFDKGSDGASDGALDRSRKALMRRWEEDKAAKRGSQGHSSAMDDITKNLPQLKLADKVQRRAAHFGFDWNSTEGVFDKLDEEIGELRAAMANGGDTAEEMGDLLFTAVNLARHLSLDAEFALRAANAKFERRFRQLEIKLAEKNISLRDASAEEMEAVWEQVKKEECS